MASTKKSAAVSEDSNSDDGVSPKDKYTDLDPFDVPIKLLMPEGKTKATTFAKAMKGLKAALVVNTASKCGNTKRHFREMVELQARFGEKGFSVLAFPSPSFG